MPCDHAQPFRWVPSAKAIGSDSDTPPSTWLGFSPNTPAPSSDALAPTVSPGKQNLGQVLYNMPPAHTHPHA